MANLVPGWPWQVLNPARNAWKNNLVPEGFPQKCQLVLHPTFVSALQPPGSGRDCISLARIAYDTRSGFVCLKRRSVRVSSDRPIGLHVLQIVNRSLSCLQHRALSSIS